MTACQQHTKWLGFGLWGFGLWAVGLWAVGLWEQAGSPVLPLT